MDKKEEKTAPLLSFDYISKHTTSQSLPPLEFLYAYAGEFS